MADDKKKRYEALLRKHAGNRDMIDKILDAATNDGVALDIPPDIAKAQSGKVIEMPVQEIEGDPVREGIRKRAQPVEAPKTEEEPWYEGWLGQGLMSGGGWMLPTERIGAEIAQALPVGGGDTGIERTYSGDPAEGVAENLVQVRDEAQEEDPWKYGLTQLVSAIPSAYVASRAARPAVSAVGSKLVPLGEGQHAARIARAIPPAVLGGTLAGGHEHAMGSATPVEGYGERFAEAAPMAAATSAIGTVALGGLGMLGGRMQNMLRSPATPEGVAQRQIESAGGGFAPDDAVGPSSTMGEVGSRIGAGLEQTVMARRPPPSMRRAVREIEEAKSPVAERAAERVMRTSEAPERLLSGHRMWETAQENANKLAHKMFYESSEGLTREVNVRPLIEKLDDIVSRRRTPTGDQLPATDTRIYEDILNRLKKMEINRLPKSKLDDEFDIHPGVRMKAREFDEVVDAIDQRLYSAENEKAVDPALKEVAGVLRDIRRGFGANYEKIKDEAAKGFMERRNRRHALGIPQRSPAARLEVDLETGGKTAQQFQGDLEAIAKQIGHIGTDNSKLWEMAQEYGVDKAVREALGADAYEAILRGNAIRGIASPGNVGFVTTVNLRNAVGMRLDPMFGLLRQLTPSPFYPSTAIGVGQERLQKEKSEVSDESRDTLRRIVGAAQE